MAITISAKGGNNTIISDVARTNICLGSGNNKVYLGGKCSSVEACDGDNDVVFNADGISVKLGEGNNKVNTLDNVIKQGEYKNKAKDVVYTDIERNIYESVKTTSIELDENLISSLSCEEQEFAKNVEWTKDDENYPSYMVQKNSDGEYHIYKHTGQDNYAAVSDSVDPFTREFALSGCYDKFGTVTKIVEYKNVKVGTEVLKNVARPLENITVNVGNGCNTGTITVKCDTLNLTQGPRSNIKVNDPTVSGQPESKTIIPSDVYTGGTYYWRYPRTNKSAAVSSSSALTASLNRIYGGK